MQITRRSLFAGVAGMAMSSLLGSTQAQAKVIPNPYYTVGLNITGAQIYNDTDHKDDYGQGYIYPYSPKSVEALISFYNQGMRVVQLPFKIERVWPDFNQPFNTEEIQRIRDFVWIASQCGLTTCLSPHNYGRYGTIPVAGIKGLVVGSDEYPNDLFAEFWRRFALEFVDNPNIWGYEIDTEPNNMGPDRWQPAAQAAVNAIRTVDKHNLLIIPGADHWASAPRWMEYSKNLHIYDPEDNLAYSATVYGDDTMEGVYTETATFYPDILVDRIQPFADWLYEHNYIGFITEWGVPTNSDAWLDAAERMLIALKKSNIGSFGWAYGEWWPDDYNLFVAPGSPMAALLGTYNLAGQGSI